MRKVEEDECGRLRGRDAMRWGWRGCLLLPVALECVTLVLLSWVFVSSGFGICHSRGFGLGFCHVFGLWDRVFVTASQGICHAVVGDLSRIGLLMFCVSVTCAAFILLYSFKFLFKERFFLFVFLRNGCVIDGFLMLVG